MNDATGLVALRFAIAAAGSGKFSLGEAGLEFVWVAAAGLGLGLIVGVVFERVARLLKDDLLIVTLSLIAPYAAYLPAERLHLSGVLAAVAAGLYGGWKAPELITATVRLNAQAVWGLFIFLLNCVVFILIGLQLPEVRAGIGHHSFKELVLYGLIVSAIVIVVRPLWVFPAAWLARLSKRTRAKDPLPPWQHIAVVSWCGMRGVVSLAAALALPMTLPNGQPFPERDFIIFLTFCVILATLVLQGLSLPAVICWLGVRQPHDDKHERRARLQIAHAALARLNKVAEERSVNETALARVVEHYEDRIRHLNDSLADTLGWSPAREELVATRQLWREAFHAERLELIELRRKAKLEEELMHQIEHEIDLEETKLGV